MSRGPLTTEVTEDDLASELAATMEAAVASVDASEATPGMELDERTGDWLYTLQYPPEPMAGSGADPMAPPFKIRISGRIYAKHIRISTSKGDGNVGNTMFHLTAAMCKLPDTYLDRIDAMDYDAITTKVAEIAKNARTALPF